MQIDKNKVNKGSDTEGCMVGLVTQPFIGLFVQVRNLLQPLVGTDSVCFTDMHHTTSMLI